MTVERLSQGDALLSVQCLDTIIKNRFRNDAATLGAWKIASHVESTGGGAEPPAPALPPAG